VQFTTVSVIPVIAPAVLEPLQEIFQSLYGKICLYISFEENFKALFGASAHTGLINTPYNVENPSLFDIVLSVSKTSKLFSLFN